MATTSAKGSGNTVNNGATVINAGNVDSTSTVTNAKSILFNADGSNRYGSAVVSKTSGGGESVKTASSSGNPADSTTHIVRMVSSNVRISGSDFARNSIHSRQKDFGAKIAGAVVDGAWDPTGISGQRSNWNSSASAKVTGGIPASLSAQDFIDPAQAGGATAAADSAANPTRSIPGELVYLQGSVIPKQDDYKAKTGG